MPIWLWVVLGLLLVWLLSKLLLPAFAEWYVKNSAYRAGRKYK